jgi:hypothetical protein
MEPAYVSQKQNRTGMEYSMDYRAKKLETAGVLPTARASLAQTVLLRRHQGSFRLSLTGFPQRLAFAAGYPSAHVLTLVGGAPTPNQKPATSNNLVSPQALDYGMLDPLPIQRGGTMAPKPRWKKALPLPINNYTPPVY